MDLFDIALKFVLKWEGGYSENPNDLGGRTNKGITQNTYNAYLKAHNKPQKSVKLITMEEVGNIYLYSYWIAAGCDKLPPKLAVLHFDSSINVGIGRANTFLKQSKKNVQTYIKLRHDKYVEFAKYGNQKVFLSGWLNRLADLEKFLLTVKD